MLFVLSHQSQIASNQWTVCPNWLGITPLLYAKGQHNKTPIDALKWFAVAEVILCSRVASRCSLLDGARLFDSGRGVGVDLGLVLHETLR